MTNSINIEYHTFDKNGLAFVGRTLEKAVAGHLRDMTNSNNLYYVKIGPIVDVKKVVTTTSTTVEEISLIEMEPY